MLMAGLNSERCLFGSSWDNQPYFKLKLDPIVSRFVLALEVRIHAYHFENSVVACGNLLYLSFMQLTEVEFVVLHA